MLQYLDKSTGLGMLQCEECKHSQREMTWSTVLLNARLFQDPSVGQLWCNTIPQHFRASDMTDILKWEPEVVSSGQTGRKMTPHWVWQTPVHSFYPYNSFFPLLGPQHSYLERSPQIGRFQSHLILSSNTGRSFLQVGTVFCCKQKSSITSFNL